MDIKLLIFFIILNLINVALQTVKSLLTNKGNKWSAAIANAVAYGVYTILLVYMTCNLSLAAKVVIVGGCNLIAVFVVKWIEEKMQKNKLWKIELTIDNKKEENFSSMLKAANISHYQITDDRYSHFYCFCGSRQESAAVREIAKKFNAKHFASESKIL